MITEINNSHRAKGAVMMSEMLNNLFRALLKKKPPETYPKEAAAITALWRATVADSKSAAWGGVRELFAEIEAWRDKIGECRQRLTKLESAFENDTTGLRTELRALQQRLQASEDALARKGFQFVGKRSSHAGESQSAQTRRNFGS